MTGTDQVRLAAFQGLADAINKLGYKASVKMSEPAYGDPEATLEVEGYRPYVQFHYQRTSGYGWARHREKGAPYFTVGDWGNKKVRRQSKGAFKFDSIATDVMSDARIRKAKDDQQNDETFVFNQNKPIAENFNDDNLNTYQTNFKVSPSIDIGAPLHVRFEIKANMTVAEAQRLFDILKQEGVLGR
jgi:hypothetical protein